MMMVMIIITIEGVERWYRDVKGNANEKTLASSP